MKFKYCFLTVICFIILLLSSCGSNKSSTNPMSSEEKSVSNFFIKDIDGSVVRQLEPDLLKAIHTQLIEENRSEDANNLSQTYDFATGQTKAELFFI